MEHLKRILGPPKIFLSSWEKREGKGLIIGHGWRWEDVCPLCSLASCIVGYCSYIFTSFFRESENCSFCISHSWGGGAGDGNRLLLKKS